MRPVFVLLVLLAARSALGGIPRVGVAYDSVDVIETNHFYDEQGRLVFDQTIYWDWSRDAARYVIRAWRLVKTPNQIPRRDGAGYLALWNDGELLRVVSAPSVRETWTQYDPELVDRNFMPKECRPELAKPFMRPARQLSMCEQMYRAFLKASGR